MSYQIFPCITQQDAEIVVLSSGLGGHASFWQPQIETLTQYFQVLVYDQEGCHADSEALPSVYSMKNMAKQVLEILQQQQIKQFYWACFGCGDWGRIGGLGSEHRYIINQSYFY